MSAATFTQGGLPGLICGQDAPCSHLLPVGDLEQIRGGGDALGHAPHDILGESMAVLSLPWADSAMVHLTWQGLLIYPNLCMLEAEILWGAGGGLRRQERGRGDSPLACRMFTASDSPYTVEAGLE